MKTKNFKFSSGFQIVAEKLVEQTLAKVAQSEQEERVIFINMMLWNKIPKAEQRKIAHIILVSASVKIIKAKLGMPKGEWEYLAQSRLMRAAINTNTLTFFTPAFASLAAWDTQNNALNSALTAIRNKVSGAAGMKTTAMTNLSATLKKALAYVNGLCLDSQINAEAIIGAAFMQMTLTGTRVTKSITVKQTTDSGSVECKCPAAKFEGKRVTATYEKGYSKDGGATWIDLPAIAKCKIVATGLTLGVPVIFRSRVTTTKGGTTTWVISQPITPQ
jgi:hypothetical protein